MNAHLVTLIKYLMVYEATESKPHGFGFDTFVSVQGKDVLFPEFVASPSVKSYIANREPMLTSMILDPTACAYLAGVQVPGATNWWEFANGVVPTPLVLGTRTSFDWIASPIWQAIDPSAKGAAQRATWLLLREAESLPPMAFRSTPTVLDTHHARFRALYQAHEGVQELLEALCQS